MYVSQGSTVHTGKDQYLSMVFPGALRVLYILIQLTQFRNRLHSHKARKKNPGLFKIEKLLAYKCEVFTHKAGTVFTERGLDVGGLSKSVDETHLAVKQRAGFHEVVNHLLPADLPVSVTANKRHKRDGRLCCWLLYSIYICVTCYGGPH